LERTTNGIGKIADYTLAELKELDAGYKFQPEGSNDYPYRGKGLQILSIDEVLPRFPNVRFNIDIKSDNPEAPKLLAEKLKELNSEERVCVGSFHQQQIIRFRKYTSVITSAGKKEVIKFLLKFFKWRKRLPKLIAEENKPVSHEVIRREHDGKIHQEIENKAHFVWGVRTVKHQKMIFGYDLPYYSLQVPMKQSIIKIISPQFIKFAHFLGIAVHVWTINDRVVMRQLLDWGVDGIFTDKPKLLLDLLK
jgi:glycerophosphoryl diester phosphodiesterase